MKIVVLAKKLSKLIALENIKNIFRQIDTYQNEMNGVVDVVQFKEGEVELYIDNKNLLIITLHDNMLSFPKFTEVISKIKAGEY